MRQPDGSVILYGQSLSQTTIRGQKNKQDLPRNGMAGGYVYAHPEPSEQMVRYYGYYSNVSRGKRQKAGNDNAVPCIDCRA